MRILVTGATGYIGGRLVPELLAAGHEVRALTRTQGWLRDVAWAGDVDVDVVTADVLDTASLPVIFEGVEVAYYLIHSLADGPDFAAKDRRAASNFAAAAQAAGVRRIVYLGGLADRSTALEAADPAISEHLASRSEGHVSEHLASRSEVGAILLAGGVPTVVLRAAVILGSGSASFEMLRYLTERLPIMIAPRWVDTRLQPIAVRDVLRYLVAAAAIPEEVNRGFDIGGPDVLTYRDMMQVFAAEAGLRRRIIMGVPLLSPNLSSHWVGLVTPVPAALARPLVRSLGTEVVCREHDIAHYVADPPEGLLGVRRSVALALQRVRDAAVQTHWSQSEWPGAPSDSHAGDPQWAGGTLFADDRTRVVHAPRDVVWTVVEGIGGKHGWYSFPLAWQIRGVLDRLVGGVGLRRGRRDDDHVRIGDALDWWRVEDVDRGCLLRLRAEMKLPGLAWLDYTVGQDYDGTVTLRQRATFYPRGLAGHAYWRSIQPFHLFVFGPMIRNIARAAERLAAGDSPGALQTPLR